MAEDEDKTPDTLGQQRCRFCGVEHIRPEFMETYRFCHRCDKESRPASSIVLKKERTKEPLQILYATYGHPKDANLAIDVTRILTKEIENVGGKSLVIDKFHNLIALFGGTDPAPNVLKALRIRYIMSSRRGELYLQEDRVGYLRNTLSLAVPSSPPLLHIEKALYGHRCGNPAFNVTEYIIGMIDLSLSATGSFLEIPAGTDLIDLFGDPCYGVTKELSITYEAYGRTGNVRQYEFNGHLIHAVSIKSTPVVAPILIIESATYGRSAYDNDVAINQYKSMLLELDIIVKRKDMGLPISFEEGRKLQTRAAIEERISLIDSFSEGDTLEDVTLDLQRYIDETGSGSELLMTSDSVNLNTLFNCDPFPGHEKYLEVSYKITGLGNTLDDKEITPTGYQRNFVTKKKNREKFAATAAGVLKPLSNDSSVIFKSLMNTSSSSNNTTMTEISIKSPAVLTPLYVLRATYGHPTDVHKQFDITEKIGIMSLRQGGASLRVPRALDLNAEFGNACRGVRKMLYIRYNIRGVAGTLRFAPESHVLGGKIQLGYPPDFRDIGTHGTPGFVERSCSTHGSKRGLHSHDRRRLVSRGSTPMEELSSRNSSQPTTTSSLSNLPSPRVIKESRTGTPGISIRKSPKRQSQYRNNSGGL